VLPYPALHPARRSLHGRAAQHPCRAPRTLAASERGNAWLPRSPGAAAQVGSTVFVHGGVLPEHAAYGLERLNADTRAWMEGPPGAPIPAFLVGRRAVVWARDYSNGALRLSLAPQQPAVPARRAFPVSSRAVNLDLSNGARGATITESLRACTVGSVLPLAEAAVARAQDPLKRAVLLACGQPVPPASELAPAALHSPSRRRVS